MDRAVPTLPAERIVALDIIRGFALLGILVVNMAGFSGSTNDQPMTPWDERAFFIVGVLFSGKFNNLFSMLFAIGFTIQLERLGRRASNHAQWIYVRRLLVLLVIGVAHAILVWDGDVLHMYALLGFVLLLLRHLSDRAVLVLIAVLLLVPGARSLALLLFASPEWTASRVASQEEFMAAAATALGSGTYLDAVALNAESLRRAPFTLTGLDGTVLLGYLLFLVTMLLGLLAGRHRWIERATEHEKLVRRAQWWGLAIGIGAGVVLAVASRFTEPFVPSI